MSACLFNHVNVDGFAAVEVETETIGHRLDCLGIIVQNLVQGLDMQFFPEIVLLRLVQETPSQSIFLSLSMKMEAGQPPLLVFLMASAFVPVVMCQPPCPR